jgi:hypothetical protein
LYFTGASVVVTGSVMILVLAVSLHWSFTAEKRAAKDPDAGGHVWEELKRPLTEATV